MGDIDSNDNVSDEDMEDPSPVAEVKYSSGQRTTH